MPSYFRVSVHDTYFHLSILLQRPAELRYFQQTEGVGDAEDLIEAAPNPADFLDKLGHINRGASRMTAPLMHCRINRSREPLTLPAFSLRSASSSSDRRMMIWLVLLRMDFPSFGPGS